ncbi:hypothetical protein PCLA_08f0320 [Pseudomonas citronellolis]|nr:hypothetical protein PCLA_08f0320 [Pseudomonas citronellolis]
MAVPQDYFADGLMWGGLLVNGGLPVGAVYWMDSATLSPALGCAPRPEGRGGLSVPREGLVSAGNLRCCRLTPEHPCLPNGPLSLQGEG